MDADPPHRKATPEEDAEVTTAAAAGVASAAWLDTMRSLSSCEGQRAAHLKSNV